MKVRKAIIPAAGLGTRFLPASKAVPKEMIPVVDKPGIQYTIEEAARAGITDILLISSAGKSAMENHFDRSLDLEWRLERAGKTDELETVRKLTELANVHSVRQREPLGFGHAVLMGRPHVGNEPFAVMVPDEIAPELSGGKPSLLARMIEIFEEKQASVLLVQEVPHESISAYGAIKPDFESDDLARIVDIVEKPAPDDAPSDLGARGRYVFTPEIFDAIERTEPGVGNEIQLTDAIRQLLSEQDVFAYVYPGRLFDVGNKVDYLRATVELALDREDLSEPFGEFIRDVAKRLDADG
ncbi:MAG: UTP--glucose-1-phosphate uridylyltransferase GalU [Actinomycetota bacterium]